MRALQLGPWTLTTTLGRGGMGVVYRAQHVERDIPAAVKILRHRGLPHEPDRLREEMQIAAGLLHEGILLVYDHGTVSPEAERASHGRLRAGRSWLAMELASGGTLAQNAHRMFWPELLDLLAALLDALAHAHAQGVIHRDLKPSNLLLADASDLRPGWKLSDFGIASVSARAERIIRGTPRYMAPEQFRGGGRGVGPWTDLYGVGCVAWEAVTGAPPFHSADPTKLALEHLYEPLPPLQPRIPVPDELEAWLRRMLTKDPDERFRHAADAGWALAGLGPANHQLVLPHVVHRPAAVDHTVDVVPGETGDLITLDGLVDALPSEVESEDVAQAMPVALPPLPETWRRGGRPPLPPSLAATPHLFGVRALPLVGRDRERDLLWSSLALVHEARSLRIVLISGDVGTGKSALSRWFGERATEVGGAEVLRARHARGASRDDGIAAMFARYLRIDALEPDAAAAALRKELRRRDVRDPAEVAALSAVLIGADDHSAQVRTATAERHAMLARLLKVLSRGRPLLVVLEDLQWAPDAADWVSWLALHAPQDLAALVVATAQPLEGDKTAAWVEQIARSPAAVVVRAGPLPAERMRDLVLHMIALEPSLADRVVARAGGSPLYVTQLLGDLVDRGALVPGPSGFVLAPGEPEALPADVAAISQRRIDRLLAGQPLQARAALELAAALGETVDVQEWREACSYAGIPFVRGLVARLARDGLATAVDGGWRFTAGLVRDVIEGTSRREGRWAPLNLAAARMLQERVDHPGRLGRIGRHLTEGNEPGAALTALLEAARRRMAKDEARTAEPILDDAARAAERAGVGRDDGRLAVLRLLRARAAKARHALDEAWEAVREVEHDAQISGWPRLEAESLAEQADIARVRGDLPLALRRFRRALVRYEALDDDQGVADTLRGLSAVALQLGSVAVAERLLHRAHGRYQEIGDRFGGGMCQCGLGDIARARGEWAEATRRFRASLSELRGLGHRSGEAMGLHGLAEVQRLTGDLDAAEEGYRQVIRLDTQLGRDNSLSRLNLALCQIERESWALAEPTLAELEGSWGAQNLTGYLAIVHVAWSVCDAARGDWRQMRERLAAAIPALEVSSLVDRDVARLASLAGHLASEAGRAEEAQVALALALDQWSALGAQGEAEDVAGVLLSLDEL